MKRKINWIIYLIIGSSFILNSCENYLTSYATKTTYVYINNSDYNIGLFVFNEYDRTIIREIPIPAGDSVTVILIGSYVPSSPFFYETNTHSIGDSVSVIFDNRKFLYYTKYTENSILDRRSYEGGLVSKNIYYLRFRFTNEDYDRAMVLE